MIFFLGAITMTSSAQVCDYCKCAWKDCCSNPGNYTVEMGGTMCNCGCKGDWAWCVDNKENNIRDCSRSPSPSPYRSDDDWWIVEPNSTIEAPQVVAPNLPEKVNIPTTDMVTINSERLWKFFLFYCTKNHTKIPNSIYKGKGI